MTPSLKPPRPLVWAAVALILFFAAVLAIEFSFLSTASSLSGIISGSMDTAVSPFQHNFSILAGAVVLLLGAGAIFVFRSK
ncbi:MAG: hypothetical protein ABFC24_10215 [Methanoregulaceae archaeon]